MNVRRTLGALFFSAGVGLTVYNIDQTLIENKPNNPKMNLTASGLALAGGMLGFRMRRRPDDQSDRPGLDPNS